MNIINIVKDISAATASGRAQTNRIGGERITAGATGENASNAVTVSHEQGGHADGAADQDANDTGSNGQRLAEDVPGTANIMKDLSGSPASSQMFGEILRAPIKVNTRAQGVSDANGGC